jgi:hypothetical protein
MPGEQMSTDTTLPPLYAKWMDQLLGGNIPTETTAVCFECSMIDRSGAGPVPGLDYYHPETKCCGYHPLLAGFLVGAFSAMTVPVLNLRAQNWRSGSIQELE